jgi:hypothetical protein
VGFLSGIGRAIKKVTKPIFGNSILDEIGTAGGFLLGGPGGAAIGRGLGKGLATGNLGEGLKGAAEGFALGTGAGALGLKGGSMGVGSLPGIGRLLGGGGGVNPAQAGRDWIMGGGGGGATGGGGLNIGRMVGQGLNWATANPQRTQLVLGGLGTGLGAFGASQEAGAARQAYGDERGDVDYQRRRNEQYDPIRMRLLERLAGGG